MTNLLRDELIRDEGLRMEAYKDSVGLWTIGVGHLLDPTPTDEPRIRRITREEAMAFLEMDIRKAEKVAEKWVPGVYEWDVVGGLEGYVRQRAVVNMAFNLGDRLGTFVNTLASLKTGNWEDAATRMLQSKWAKQVGQRAVRLSNMVRTGMTL